MSVYRLSVTFVHPTQPVEIFGNFSSPFGTLAIRVCTINIILTVSFIESKLSVRVSFQYASLYNIATSSQLCKTFEAIVRDDIVEFLEKNELIKD